MYSATYFPIHRAKRGEISATGFLSPVSRTRIRPIFDIQKHDVNSRVSIESFLSEMAREFSTNWGLRSPICFDFSRYDPDEKVRDGGHPAEYFFLCARQKGIQAIPVAGPESVRGPGYEYLHAVGRVAERDCRGAVVRMPYREFSRADTLPDVIDDVLKAIGLHDADVDLVLDLEALALLPAEASSEIGILGVITEALQTIGNRKFRNVVLCGSSIPEQVDQRFNWNPLKIPRVELAVWRELITRVEGRHVKYGDYGIMCAHGSDAKAPRPPPSRIRLSTPTHYLLCRAPASEYRKLSAAVMKHEDFRSDLEAWGSASILRCGVGSGGEGSPTDWVARDTNLHLEATAQLIESDLTKHGLIKNLEFATPDRMPWSQEKFPGMGNLT